MKRFVVLSLFFFFCSMFREGGSIEGNERREKRREKDNYVVERGKRDREFLNGFMATVPTNLFLSL